MSSLVRLAAWIPPSSATRRASPLGPPSISFARVFADMRDRTFGGRPAGRGCFLGDIDHLRPTLHIQMGEGAGVPWRVSHDTSSANERAGARNPA